MPSDFCLLHLRTTDEKVGRDRARPSLIKGAMNLVAAALFSAQKPKKSRPPSLRFGAPDRFATSLFCASNFGRDVGLAESGRARL
jgi:hypothetical protein